MMGIGTIRFLLALAVLLLHADFVTFEVAQIAVLTFFFISGFLMERAFPRYSTAGRFLINRSIRLIPSFIAVAGVTWLIIYFATEDFRRSFGHIYLRSAASYNAKNPPSLTALGSLERDAATLYLGFDSEIVPQAWSIGNEMVYYLTIPFLALLTLRRFIFITSVNAIIFLALVLVHFADFDYLVYTNLLATYIFFVAGYLLAKTGMFRLGQGKRTAAKYCAVIFILGSYFFDFPTSISPVLVIGSAIALILLVLIGFLAEGEIERKESNISKILGKLSYPLYISHMIAIGVLNALALLSIPLLIITATSFAALIYLLLDRPLERVRSKVRN